LLRSSGEIRNSLLLKMSSAALNDKDLEDFAAQADDLFDEAIEVAEPEEEKPLEFHGENARVVSGNDALVSKMLSFLPTSSAQSYLIVSKVWMRGSRIVIRERTRKALSLALPAPLASTVETELFKQKEKLSVYLNKVREFNSSLASNSTLKADLLLGRLAPQDFVKMSVDLMIDHELKQKDKQYREEALKARIKQPPMGNVIGRWTCEECGCTSQYVRRFVRAGQLDLTKYSEIMICINCLSTGPFTPVQGVIYFGRDGEGSASSSSSSLSSASSAAAAAPAPAARADRSSEVDSSKISAESGGISAKVAPPPTSLPGASSSTTAVAGLRSDSLNSGGDDDAPSSGSSTAAGARASTGVATATASASLSPSYPGAASLSSSPSSPLLGAPGERRMAAGGEEEDCGYSYSPVNEGKGEEEGKEDEASAAFAAAAATGGVAMRGSSLKRPREETVEEAHEKEEAPPGAKRRAIEEKEEAASSSTTEGK
jgi:Transcription factor S-II (TFIIS), central domain